MGKYFKYAVGEILLVVIGILIALQINNWNQHQKDLKTESQILNSLHQEFKTNSNLLKGIIEVNTDVTNTCTILMDVSLHANKNKINLDSLLYNALEGKPFISSNNTYTEIINTGEIELIQNENVKSLLFEYNRMINSNKSTYSLFEKWLEEHILPYLAQHISLRNIDKYGAMAWKKSSRFDHDLSVILNDRTFENLIDNNIYHLNRLNEEYNNLLRISEELIKVTEAND
ncbi:DUF6090 family protein [Winogradskyella sp.]|uniref:DUF6090 family protein n=1 Tax=Winogradskyella sp. TaxID=1883156 RepID=UPI00260864AA|nr:DUF6090 family protein [Winogradskyella sp.]